MANDDVAMRAGDLLERIAMMREHFAHEALMAAYTIGIQDGFAARSNADGFVEIIQGKTLRMQKTALGFDQIFSNDLFGSMAIIARGSGMVTRFFPAVVLIVHDVAVFASHRVIG